MPMPLCTPTTNQKKNGSTHSKRQEQRKKKKRTQKQSTTSLYGMAMDSISGACACPQIKAHALDHAMGATEHPFFFVLGNKKKTTGT